jgi:hypothetical protein
MPDEPDAASTWIVDLAITVIMALAAVGTAWAGFQSTKWGGVQANSYAASGAARTMANRLTVEATQLRTIDVISFTSWLNALNQEIIAGTTPRPAGRYVPNPQAISGFLFQRFRPEFKPAMQAWLATNPVTNPAAPPTPFAMPQYVLAADAMADRESARADQLAATARAANQRGDNYVLTAVIFALVLFFSGVASRARRGAPQNLLLGLAAVTLVSAVIALALMPIQF